MRGLFKKSFELFDIIKVRILTFKKADLAILCLACHIVSTSGAEWRVPSSQGACNWLSTSSSTTHSSPEASSLHSLIRLASDATGPKFRPLASGSRPSSDTEGFGWPESPVTLLRTLLSRNTTDFLHCCCSTPSFPKVTPIHLLRPSQPLTPESGVG